MKTKSSIISLVAAILTMIIGILVLIGWYTRNDFLRMIIPGQVKMKFNVASCFVLSSIALLLNYSPGKNKIKNRISVLLSVIIFLIGLFTLAEYIFGINIGIDEIFVKDELRTTAIYYAGRMSPLSAVNFILISISLVLLNKEKASAYQFYSLFSIAFVSLIMLIGFNFIIDIPTFIRLAIHVSIGFITLSTAIWFAQPMLQRKISFERKLFTGFTAIFTLMAILGIFSSYYSSKLFHTDDESIVAFKRTFYIFLTGVFILLITIFFYIRNNIIIRKKAEVEIKTLNSELEQRVEERSADLQKSLKEIEDYKYALDESSIVAITDQRGIIKHANQNFSNISKYSIDELIGQDHRIINSGHHSKELIRNLWTTIANGKIWKGELKNKARDGTFYWVDTTIIPFLNENGKPYQYVAIRADITMRKEAEEEVIRAYRENETVLNRINDGVVSVDNDWRYTFLNDAAMATHPLGKEATLGKIIWDIHPEMKGTVFWDKYHEAMETRKVVEIENHYAPMNTWFSVKVYPSSDGLTIFYKDVTERKRFEEQQTLFSSIVNSSDDAILSTTLDGVITSWNQGAEKVFGYTPGEIIGNHISIIIPAHLLDEEAEIIKKVRKGENVKYYETQRIKKDGKVIYVSLTISPIKDLHGNVIGASKISRDITNQKETEEKLAYSERHFRALIENSAEGIALTDEFSNNIYRSPAALKLMGAVPKENTVTLAHPDDLETIKNKRAEAMRNPGLPVSFQGRFLHSSGHYVWLEGTLINLLHVRGVNAVVTNFRDITQRKEAEEKIIKSEKIYKTIASSIPGSVICLLDTDYRYLLIEGDMLEKLGYSKEKLLGNKAADVLSPEIFATVQNEFKRTFNGEIVTRESSNRGYDIISRFIPLKDENNTVYAIMTVAIDVTELKNAQRNIVELNRGLEEKIIKRTEQLKKSNEELEAFSYSVSHDLRAPLRGIIAFASILDEEYGNKLDNEARRIISIIKNNTLKMGTLIDDLLAFSRMGKLGIAKVPVDIKNMVKELVAELVQQNKGKSKISWNIHDLLPVNADMNMIRQVWINLISNAIKYSGNREKPGIEIGAYRAEEQMVFYVKDNGVGFDEEYKHKLFKVFQRLHDAEEFEGTGVGLALVEKIVSRHEGKVWAEGREDEGACFYFSLPA